MTLRRVTRLRGTLIGLILVATAIAALWLYQGSQRDVAAHLDREIDKLRSTIAALETRIDSGKYPALEDHMKRQLTEQREQLQTLLTERSLLAKHPTDD